MTATRIGARDYWPLGSGAHAMRSTDLRRRPLGPEPLVAIAHSDTACTFRGSIEDDPSWHASPFWLSPLRPSVPFTNLRVDLHIVTNIGVRSGQSVRWDIGA
jgi:hypothetical protein